MVVVSVSLNNFFQIQSISSDTGLHPTQKPLKLMELLIELTTQEEQIVLEPFCGSGTTLLAAKKLHRKYIGFENNADYFSIAQQRLELAEREYLSLLFN